jgi:vancomycin resistance protein YoaR
LPWNIDVKVTYDSKAFRYNLADNLDGLTPAQKQDRGVYLGKAGKAQLAQKLIAIGLPTDAVYCYLLPNFKTVLDKITTTINKPAIDATVTFHPNTGTKFRYTDGKNGVEVDNLALFKRLIANCGSSGVTFALPVKTLKCVTVADLKKINVLRASFTTTYYNSDDSRCHNIALATSKISGAVVQDCEKWSFNGHVGDRNEAEGYQSAKVIIDGQYVDGFGGGVCQVSTTLYNALLLSDIHVTNACQHSLVPRYIAAGFDAMVAYPYSDLTFVNETGSPIYIEGIAADRRVTFNIYGAANPYVIKTESVEIERSPFTTQVIFDREKYPDIIYTDQFKVVRSGSDYVESQSFLHYFKDGVEVKTVPLRKNKYKLVEQLVTHGTEQRPVF